MKTAATLRQSEQRARADTRKTEFYEWKSNRWVGKINTPKENCSVTVTVRKKKPTGEDQRESIF